MLIYSGLKLGGKQKLSGSVGLKIPANKVTARPGEDMNFIFKWKNMLFFFLPRENKIRIFKPPCNFLFVV